MKRLTIDLGLSPCPNDTFIFHALLHGLVSTDLQFEPYLADVEKLNGRVLQGVPAASKISLGVLPHAMDRYAIMSSGAALGWGCGPLLVAREPLEPHKLEKAAIAIPGRMTTANMLLNLHGGFQGPRLEMLFSDIIPAVASGRVDAGIIIHEGRFTYRQSGLHKILDMGQWWEDNFHLPLPLGAIAVRRDLDEEIARMLERDIAASLAHARAHPEDSAEFVRANAQELDPEVIKAHIETFVTDYSMDLGETGREAIIKLLAASLPDDQTVYGKKIFL